MVPRSVIRARIFLIFIKSGSSASKCTQSGNSDAAVKKFKLLRKSTLTEWILHLKYNFLRKLREDKEVGLRWRIYRPMYVFRQVAKQRSFWKFQLEKKLHWHMLTRISGEPYWPKYSHLWSRKEVHARFVEAWHPWEKELVIRPTDSIV